MCKMVSGLSEYNFHLRIYLSVVSEKHIHFFNQISELSENSLPNCIIVSYITEGTKHFCKIFSGKSEVRNQLRFNLDNAT